MSYGVFCGIWCGCIIFVFVDVLVIQGKFGIEMVVCVFEGKLLVIYVGFVIQIVMFQIVDWFDCVVNLVLVSFLLIFLLESGWDQVLGCVCSLFCYCVMVKCLIFVQYLVQ